MRLVGSSTVKFSFNFLECKDEESLNLSENYLKINLKNKVL